MTIDNNTYPRVTEVMKITDTAEGNGAYELEIKVQYAADAVPVLETYFSRPNDPFGVNPQIRQWMSENPEAPVHVYEPPSPPTPEEIRAAMPKLSARQFRIGLVRGGFTLAQVTSVIEAMPEGATKEEAKIEWEYATTFDRMHPLIASVGAALGLSDEQIDAMWTGASAL
ncbi:hypothetical protein GOD03_11785 [Sinorhizobium medicae]|uniref:hypothetical protein n=1 Tax=Sinorhizobium medicae TaxID=110321 RepID=UPI001AAFBBE5|nr:hypothetical protein [Sinorhizobium medicae]MBO1963813.1 hypothetical protein [Sinorhizobium medicae]MDX0615164.1 hypothetical protein [Sinorhizobium medicae]MDX0651752.1 hypothetical protein [Sinorhizobium medicae]MDX0700916.1 hypothetical protein [Sinorhizobium medicae]